MRLSRSASVAKQGKDRVLGNSRARKKHKRLDAICEKAYNQSHGRVGGSNSCEFNVGVGEEGGESELRRSSRVRRAPVLLDSSPPPPKKRRRVEKRSGGGINAKSRRDDGGKSESPCSTSKSFGEDSCSWRSRLRSGGKHVSFEVIQKDNYSAKGKRKLFADLDVNEDHKFKAEGLDGKEMLENGKSTIVKSKRPGRVKASHVSGNENQEIELDGSEQTNKCNQLNTVEENDEDCSLMENQLESENDGEVKDGAVAPESIEKTENEAVNYLELEECTGNVNTNYVEQENQMEQPGCVEERVNQYKFVDVAKFSTSQTEDEASHERALEDKGSENVVQITTVSNDLRDKPRIKEGRRCGLCGGGTDGKPPKKLVHDGTGSDNEAYSGSSAAEEPNYDIWDGFGDEPSWLGRLLGPINDRFGIAGIWVHQNCAVWSPEVYFAGLGCLKNVRAALCRGRVLKCSRCGRQGATIGCRVDRCPKTYHLPCARDNGCIFDHRKFLIACTDHRNFFQPHGSQHLRQLKKMKAKKLKMEMRKLSNDAWRRDLESEEKWLENCGEDEEFLKRESKRLHRDLLRTAPVYIGGSNSESGIQFQGWESVAGLQDVIQSLKEVVILPLLYPELFCNLGLTPPRGVLLHGYPGTGKTLVVRALIGSCARGDKRIAYFARKGADCLGKYVGDAERQLRLLFQVAEKSQPSIIFFDEIDGLAPSRTRQQDQTHNSVVSTLLALLDGLKSRGSVVVIGATNRPDAVDPALRRPGRFDREIYFPLPSVKDREAILSLHTQKWPKPVTGPLLKWVARRTVGFAGADLQALCTQAAIIALKRSCPWQEILSEAGKRVPQGKHPLLPTFTVEERDWLEALSCAPPPCSRREAGMAANDVIASPLEVHLIPCLLQPLSRLLVSLYLDERLWLPPPIFKAATLIKRVIVSALDEKNVQTDCWWSHVHDLLQEADVATQIENNLACAGIVVGDANVAHFECLDDSSDNVRLDFEPYKMQRRVACSSLLPNMSFASGKRTGFRILISGSLRSGQKHLASCLLHCFVGNIEIHKVDLATVLQEGHGDVVQGLTQILLRCSSAGSCMIFMPRVDLWAIEKSNDNCRGQSVSPVVNHESSVEKRSCLTDSEVDKGLVCKSTEETESQVAALGASFLWKSFIEQVESISVSTSLMILATSEVPFPILPPRVKQFFKNDTLNCSPLTPQEDTVPRFSLHVEGNFNHDLAINSSASKLCKDVGQLFVQLIHHRNHSNLDVQKQHHARGTIEGEAGANCLNLDPVSTIEPGSNLMSPTIPTVKYPLRVDNKTVKEKSNLLLAISTFGYQILWYPHFAELCWVTSKLKEGPFADVIGPWKGWPFNSCIVRPSSALGGRVAVVCSPSNVKPKEKSSIVRGLTAVGLSAYRGVYTSLREVCSDVKKVLELLTRQIDTKIQAGKDRYQFMRVLSQVAHMEDLVSSWAYSLQSLEVDAQLAGKDSELTAMESLDECKDCQNDSIESDDKLNVPCKCLHGSEVPEERAQVVGTGNVDPVDLTGGECGPPNGNDGEAMHPRTLHDFAPGVQLQSSKISDPLGIKLLKGQNGFTSEPHLSEDSGRDAEFGKDVNILQKSNGVVHVDSVVLSEDGPCSPSDLGGVKLSRAGKHCNQDTILSPAGINIPTEDGKSNVDRHNGNASSSNISAGLPHKSGVTCLYNCCSNCLFNLHNVICEILNDEWGVKRNDWTVEDVNDVVASLSVDLHSTVTKYWMVGSSSDSFDKIQNTCRELNGREMGCRCENSGSGLVMPMECTCHAMHESRTAKAIFSDNLERGLTLRLIFRDGVLAAIDPDKDVSFHCKFRTLCLCSLIEWIVMAKRPLD